MKEFQKLISISIDEIIDTEYLLGEEIQNILKIFKQEKEQAEFYFGTLCVIHYEAYTDSFNQDIYKIAAAIELLILSLDIIDDLQDKDTDYVWMKTPELSLNSVLAMLILVSKVIRESTFQHRNFVLQAIEKYTLISINGQQLDLLNVCQDESSYLQMIEKKSGSLTAMSCLVGTILAIGKEIDQIKQYGTSIGIIQQIKNDIQGLKELTNKNDLLNKRYSLPIIYLHTIKSEFSEDLRSYYSSDGTLDGYILADVLKSSGALRYAIAIKNIYKNKAIVIINNNTKINMQRKDYLINLMK
ncbi:polyprenyl synthetase family protein [Solibacillus sp. MA9]|uniref:Polyprenyl synthetase family protein n=1 Tax=Solibacillus palustris TaxID=2908203 RepID=A0ABS9UI12_9BACL|nr:polyprenyl synthetase family protein [Solibacillus sp. MA9]MCH7324005.1 polyprenyl synthetase family protein [Solibacillus sp. MA9]